MLDVSGDGDSCGEIVFVHSTWRSSAFFSKFFQIKLVFLASIFSMLQIIDVLHLNHIKFFVEINVIYLSCKLKQSTKKRKEKENLVVIPPNQGCYVLSFCSVCL